VAVHPAGSTVYVANTGSDTVSVIDATTNTVTATVGVGHRPFGVAVHPAGNAVYVANQGSDTVSVIDTATNTITAIVGVERLPQGVSVHPAGNAVYVANQGSDTVSVIKTATNTVIATVNVGVHPNALGQFISSLHPPPQSVADFVETSVGGTRYDRRTGQSSCDVTVTNISETVICSPIWLVIESISDDDVTLVEPDGFTTGGKPYMDFSNLLGDSRLDPGESIIERLYFYNPNRLRFTFELSVYGLSD
jgi:YVTN family beta-propeller protein